MRRQNIYNKYNVLTVVRYILSVNLKWNWNVERHDVSSLLISIRVRSSKGVYYDKSPGLLLDNDAGFIGAFLKIEMEWAICHHWAYDSKCCDAGCRLVVGDDLLFGEPTMSKVRLSKLENSTYASSKFMILDGWTVLKVSWQSFSNALIDFICCWHDDSVSKVWPAW